MACVKLTNTTFIGDTILLKYLSTLLDVHDKQLRVRNVSRNRLIRVNCDFVVEDLFLYEVKEDMQKLVEVNYRCDERVVIMIGTYDILECIHGSEMTCDKMMENLRRLMRFLHYAKAKEIILCTIPPLLTTTTAENDEIQYAAMQYNEYIRSWDGIQIKDTIVKVVDIYSVLQREGMLESDSILPNKYGYQKLHEALREFL